MKIFTRALHGLTGCYVMDALAGRELDRFERHLHRCLPCAGEVRGLAETATRIAMAVSRPPPPGLREQVLTAATRTRQLLPVTEPRPSPRRRSPPLPRPVSAVVGLAAVAGCWALALGIAELMGERSGCSTSRRPRSWSAA